jgi:nucleotide-binding universal stress UspA family protein
MNEVRRTRVVVGVGESPAGLQALRYAVAEARRRGSVLHVVRVLQYGSDVYGLYPSRLAEDASGVIQRAFDEALGGLPPDLEAEMIVVDGAVGPRLVAQATNDGDLLVVGASSRHRWARPIFTVAGHCVRLALCPVVVVPPPALAREGGVRALRRAIRREAEQYARVSGPSKLDSWPRRQGQSAVDRHH